MMPAKSVLVLNAARASPFQRCEGRDILECFSVSKMSAAEAAGQGGGSAARNNPPSCPPEPLMPVGLLTLELHIRTRNR